MAADAWIRKDLATMAAPPYWRLSLPLAAFLGLATGALISLYGCRPLIAWAGLVLAAVVLWRPYIGFLLVIASIPADVLGVIGGTQATVVLSVTKILAVMTISSVLFQCLIHRVWPSFSRLLTPETLLVLAFVLLAALLALVHPNTESRTALMRLLTIALFVFITVYFVDRPERLRHVAWTLVLVATLVAVQSILQRQASITNVSEEWVAQSGAVLDVGEEATGEFLRSTGSFSHPAWLGLFLTLVIPLTLYVIWTTRSWRIVAAGMIGVVIQVLGVFTTYSRMAYIGAAFGVLLFLLRRRFGPALLVISLMGALATLPLLPDPVRSRISSIIDYQSSSSSLTRLGQQMAGLMMFRDHPLTGVGPGNFESHVMHYSHRIPEVYNVQPIGAHNMYVQLAAELGAGGLLVGLAILGVSWHSARRLRIAAARRGDWKNALLYEALGIALLVFCVSAFFVHAEDRKEWWLVVALIAAARQFERSGAPKETGAQR